MTEKKVLAWLLTVCVLLSTSPAAFGEAPEEPASENEAAESEAESSPAPVRSRVIRITSADALQEYALQCRMDDFSVGDTVYLENDIDFKGVPFHPFPSFSGTFEGGGHIISGFVNAEDGSNQGLFRYIEESGSVKELKVIGTVVSTEIQKEIGGIAGTNYGLIDSCSFTGIVSGKEMTGGICGSNYGRVVNCRAEGTVSGKTMVGGICGYNNGSIYKCRNRATVNPDTWKEDSTPTVSPTELVSIIRMDISEIITAISSDTTTDVGGIAGYSDHVIYVCSNYGAVGYPHYGYNVGGIAGRQSNILSKCNNFGTVLGRSDVGGIVGQNEPYMDMTDRMTMAGEIQALSDQFDDTTETLAKDAKEGSEIVDDIATDTGGVLDSTEMALNDTGRLDSMEDNIKEDYGVDIELNDMEHPELKTDTQEDEGEEKPGLVDKFLDGTKGASGTIDADYVKNVRNNASDAEKDEIWDVTRDAINNSGSGLDINDETTGKARDKADNTRNKANDLVGEDTVNNVLGGDVSEDDIYRIAYAGTDNGIDGIGSGVDWVTLRREEAKAEAERTADDLTADVVSGAASLKSLGNDYAALGIAMKEAALKFTDGSKEINTHFTNVMNMIADALAGSFNLDIMQDVSEINDADSLLGTVTDSNNYGSVDGDGCVGGIAGAMGIESDYDLNGLVSDSLASSGLFSNTYETTCIVRGCENNGTVNAKRDNSGGIVGKQDMGLIIGSENYGDVSSAGKYSGGVVGLSYSTVNTCYSKCAISGTDYVGGIAGSGNVIYDCMSLSTLKNTDGSYVGSIAGYADMSAEREVEPDSGISADALRIVSQMKEGEESPYTFVTEKCVTGNFYVGSRPGGVNGVSYARRAEPIAYKTAMDYSGLPERLNSWTLTFKAEGRTVDTVEFEYGDSINELPPVPQKNGYTGFWENFETENLTASRTVEAVYVKNGNTVEGDLLREKSGLCVVLVEGPIRSNSKVKVSFRDSYKGQKIGGRKILEAVTVTMTDNGDGNTEYIIRYNLPTGAGEKLYLLSEDGTWQRVQTEKQGSYLVFHSTMPVTFAAVSSSHGILIAAVSVTAAALIGVVPVMGRKRKASAVTREH